MFSTLFDPLDLTWGRCRKWSSCPPRNWETSCGWCWPCSGRARPHPSDSWQGSSTLGWGWRSRLTRRRRTRRRPELMTSWMSCLLSYTSLLVTSLICLLSWSMLTLLSWLPVAAETLITIARQTRTTLCTMMGSWDGSSSGWWRLELTDWLTDFNYSTNCFILWQNKDELGFFEIASTLLPIMMDNNYNVNKKIKAR